MEQAYNQAAYNEAVNKLKEVASGRRGWVSLTAYSKLCGVPKEQLAVVARALGLEIQRSHGQHGMTASSPEDKNRNERG